MIKKSGYGMRNNAKWLEELEAMPRECMSEEDIKIMEELQKIRDYYNSFDNIIICYDREGKEIDYWTYMGYSNDFEYKVIDKDTFGFLVVSTVWLGVDLDWRKLYVSKDIPIDRSPVIFETMIFDIREHEDQKEYVEHNLHLFQCKYCTEKEAIEGHKKACRLAAEAIYLEYLKGQNNA